MLSGSVTEVSASQPSNAASPMIAVLLPKVTEGSLRQYSNACLPISLTPSGIRSGTENARQLWNAEAPISVRVEGRSTPVR